MQGKTTTEAFSSLPRRGQGELDDSISSILGGIDGPSFNWSSDREKVMLVMHWWGATCHCNSSQAMQEMIQICRDELYPTLEEIDITVQGWALLEAAGYRYTLHVTATGTVFIPTLQFHWVIRQGRGNSVAALCREETHLCNQVHHCVVDCDGYLLLIALVSTLTLNRWRAASEYHWREWRGL